MLGWVANISAIQYIPLDGLPYEHQNTGFVQFAHILYKKQQLIFTKIEKLTPCSEYPWEHFPIYKTFFYKKKIPHSYQLCWVIHIYQSEGFPERDI